MGVLEVDARYRVLHFGITAVRFADFGSIIPHWALSGENKVTSALSYSLGAPSPVLPMLGWAMHRARFCY